MEVLEIFQVLGIGETKDEGEIKKAYREKLAVTNPEDNPEGFKRLRMAYEEACRYAKQVEEPEEEQEVTPAGLWVQKAAEIYGRIDTRCDVNKWEELFKEDIFLSLEGEEECRFLMLRFLMEHYKLPTDVWQLLDEKLNIVDGVAQLKEKFPADFLSFIANKCERGEDVEFDQFEGEPDAAYDMFLQYYDRCWQALNEDKLEQAEEYIKNADDLHIFHPVMEVCRANLLLKQEKTEEAIALLRNLRERFPKDALVGYNLAEMLWKNGRKEESAAVYEELNETHEKHYMANVRLTEWYYECGRFQEAKKCAEDVLSVGADDNFMEVLGKVNHELEKEMEATYEENADFRTGLDLCWCYLQDGRVSHGIRLAVELEKKIPKEKQSEYYGLLSKLYVEAAEYEDALTMAEVWEQSLIEKISSDEEEEALKDQDRIRQSHVIRMQCHRSLGYIEKEHFAKAISEAEIIETGTSKDIGLLLEKAQIYMEMEEYEKSLDVIRRLLEDYQIFAAYATAIEVYRREWEAQGVVQCGRQCINYFPNYVRAYEQVAKVYLDLNHTEELKELLEEATQNGIESVILDAYRYQMEHEVPSTEVLDEKINAFRDKYLTGVEDGKEEYYQKGLPIITEYLYWYPGTYMLVERGIFHKAANRLEEAKQDFEKALVENPAQPYALNGLSFVYKFQGDYEKALVCLKKAILYLGDEKSASVYADLGELYSLLGNHEMALASYRCYTKEAGNRKSIYHMRNMAKCLATCGHVFGAMDILEAIYLNKPQLYAEEIEIYQTTGNEERARRLLEKWNKELAGINQATKREYAEYYCHMAWQELLFGSGKKAVEYFEKVVKNKAYDKSVSGDYCDLIFACILCGDDSRGKLYAAKLREWQKKEKAEGRDDYYNQEKGRLHLNFLANYYNSSEETLDALLQKEETSQICHFCTLCVCKEIEGIRILHMLRKGETEAAMARLERNLKKQPMDEYMLAIKHIKSPQKVRSRLADLFGKK